MNITRLQITIEPWSLGGPWKELRVEVASDGETHTVSTPFEEDDFESRFDYLMDQSRQEIKRLVKAHREKKP